MRRIVRAFNPVYAAVKRLERPDAWGRGKRSKFPAEARPPPGDRCEFDSGKQEKVVAWVSRPHHQVLG